jgi:hypothetical protein
VVTRNGQHKHEKIHEEKPNQLNCETTNIISTDCETKISVKNKKKYIILMYLERQVICPKTPSLSALCA